MNLLSKLFSTYYKAQPNHAHNNTLQHIKNLFTDNGEFYTNVFLSYEKEKKTIKYILLHPNSGVVLFNFFDYSLKDLKDATLTKAQADDEPDIKPNEEKKYIQLRFNEVYSSQIAPVHSILICSNLNEEDFNSLHESFHELMPKSLTLFKDSNAQKYKDVVLCEKKPAYNINKIKKTLFSELAIVQNNSLMTKKQQKAVHSPLDMNFLIKGLPGSGKSSVLVAKALYEKMKDPKIKPIFFVKNSCSVQQFQILIFKFIDYSNWKFNKVDIKVCELASIDKHVKDKDKYNLVVCDNIYRSDLQAISSILNKKTKLMVSSYYDIEGFSTYTLGESFRVAPCISAACEGLLTENLNEHVSFKDGDTIENTNLILESLLNKTSTNKINIVHHNEEELLKLQTKINASFNNISYMYDNTQKNNGLILYPLNKLSCLSNEYLIIIIDEDSQYDPIELISRATKKSFILSKSKEVYKIIEKIKDM